MIALAAVVLAGVGLRAFHLDADAPARFPNGYSSSAPLKDESAKCFAPRNRALFGQWRTSPHDDYQYWETLSPVWTWSTYLWFELFGTGYKEARAWALLWSALSIIALYAALGARSREAALFSAALMALNFYAVIFGRLALLETPVNALLLIAFAFQVRALDRPVMLGPAAAAWLCAWLVKQSAVVYLPVLALGAALVWSRAERGREKRAGLLLAALFVVVAGLFLLSWDYRIRTVMNVRHALAYFPDQSYTWMRADPGRTLAAIKENLTVDFVRGYLAMMPVAAPLALVEVVLVVLALIKSRRADYVGVLAVAWWVCARAALTLQGQKVVRFYLVGIPPAVLLAGLAVHRLAGLYREKGGGPGKVRALMAALLVCAGVMHLPPWLSWASEYPREIKKAAQEIERIIKDERAVVAGRWAPPLCFDTRYKTYYIKSVFNRKASQIRSLGITHVVLSREAAEGREYDPVSRRLKRFFPSPYERREKLGTIVMWEGGAREVELSVYSISIPRLERAGPGRED